MADSQLKAKIHRILKEGLFNGPNDLVDVSDGHSGDDSIHVVVVSRKFDNMHLRQKDDILSDVLHKHLEPHEWGQITLAIGVSPEEVKAVI
jgi:stress-induced morphogen